MYQYFRRVFHASRLPVLLQGIFAVSFKSLTLFCKYQNWIVSAHYLRTTSHTTLRLAPDGVNMSDSDLRYRYLDRQDLPSPLSRAPDDSLAFSSFSFLHFHRILFPPFGWRKTSSHLEVGMLPMMKSNLVCPFCGVLFLESIFQDCEYRIPPQDVPAQIRPSR